MITVLIWLLFVWHYFYRLFGSFLHMYDSKANTLSLVVQNGATPLCISAQNGHVDVCALLLEKGANIEAVDEVLFEMVDWIPCFWLLFITADVCGFIPCRSFAYF